MALLMTIEHATVDEVKELINQHGTGILEHTDASGKTAFLRAVAANNFCLVEYLVASCNVNVEARDRWGQSALCLAIHRNGSRRLVQYLVEDCNANVNVMDTPLLGSGKSSWSALLAAESCGRYDIVRYLLQQSYKSVDMEVTDEFGNTTLLFLCRTRASPLELIQLLVEQRHANVEALNNLGETALYVACIVKRLDVVRYLCRSRHANVLVVAQNGDTVIHAAVRNSPGQPLCRIQLVLILVEQLPPAAFGRF